MDKKSFYLIIFFLLPVINKGAHFASKPNKRCMPGFTVRWTKEVSTTPFSATPLVADIDADGSKDIIAATFSGDVHVLKADDGKPIVTGNWPHRLPQSTFHSTPLMHDINRDGMLDVLLFTSQGELHAVSSDGVFMKKFQLDGLNVKKSWYQDILTAEKETIHDFILDNSKEDLSYVCVDPHILATPVVIDLNRDGTVEEVVIPVTYYYDMDFYSNPELFEQLQDNLNFTDLSKYLACGLILFNLTDWSVIRTVPLELTKVDSEYPGYFLFTPTVIDLDGDGGPLEIVCGTSAGNLHVFQHNGDSRPGFPIPTDVILGQITVEDVTGDGRLDLVMTDTGGNVVCYDNQGQIQWESHVSGSSPSGSRVVDLHGNGHLQLTLTSDDGNVWVLDGKTGKVVEGWPFIVRTKLRAPPLVSKVETLADPVLIVLDSSGLLHILGQHNCRHAITLKEDSYVPVIADDLIPSSVGLEFLVATADGALVCIGQNNQTGLLPTEVETNLDVYSWPGELRSANDFLYGKYSVAVDWPSGIVQHITSSSFTLTVLVIDHTPQYTNTHGYTVQVSVGNILLKTVHIQKAFEGVSVQVESPSHPMKGHLVVTCLNQHGKISQKIIPVRFHQSIGDDLQWLLVAPTLTMALIVLLLYGFPPEDLLPSFQTNKNS